MWCACHPCAGLQSNSSRTACICGFQCAMDRFTVLPAAYFWPFTASMVSLSPHCTCSFFSQYQCFVLCETCDNICLVSLSPLFLYGDGIATACMVTSVALLPLSVQFQAGKGRGAPQTEAPCAQKTLGSRRCMAAAHRRPASQAAGADAKAFWKIDNSAGTGKGACLGTE
jgi:hypothetical protein